MTGQDGLSPSFVETIAGFTAGIVSTLCLHPLDLIKTRLQGMNSIFLLLTTQAKQSMIQLIEPRHPPELVVPSESSATSLIMRAASPRSIGD